MTLAHPKPLQERTFWSQLAIMAGLIVTIGAPMWAAVIWASDQAINDKYATDEDVTEVKETVNSEVSTLKDTVAANTTSLEATAKSVDGLTLVVLDLERKALADEIYNLEMMKREEGAGWNQSEEANLREKQQALMDLNTQRQALFARVMQQ